MNDGVNDFITIPIFEKNKFEQIAGENILHITGGTVEQNNNKIVILAE